MFIMQDSEEQMKLNFGIWHLKYYFFEDHAADLFIRNLRSPSRNFLAVMKPEGPSSKEPACDVHKPSPCFTLVYFAPFRFKAHCNLHHFLVCGHSFSFYRTLAGCALMLTPYV